VPNPKERSYRRGRSWEIIEAHYASRAAFSVVHRGYESRVQGLVAERGMSRDQIRLTPAETTALFDTPELEALIDGAVGRLRMVSHAFFRESNIADPYDSEVSKIWHELSILKEEHLSVRDFPRDGNVRAFARLFHEVSQYYPKRLRRVRDLFARAQKRLDALLPQFQEDAIVLRSAFLYRADLWPDSPQASLTRFLSKMFADEGAAEGYLEVARSFFKAGFFAEATECARMGVATASKEAQARGGPAQELRETIREMDKLVSRADAEAQALENL